MAETLLSTKEASEYCSVSASFLNKRRVKGGGPEYLKLGSKVSYPKSALDEWLSEHRRRKTRSSTPKTRIESGRKTRSTAVTADRQAGTTQ